MVFARKFITSCAPSFHPLHISPPGMCFNGWALNPTGGLRFCPKSFTWNWLGGHSFHGGNCWHRAIATQKSWTGEVRPNHILWHPHPPPPPTRFPLPPSPSPRRSDWEGGREIESISWSYLFLSYVIYGCKSLVEMERIGFWWLASVAVDSLFDAWGEKGKKSVLYFHE